MKKLILLLCTFLFPAIGFAQVPISLSYKSPLEMDLDIAMLTKLMNINTITAELKGDFKGKNATITEHIVKKAEDRTTKVPSFYPMNDSTTFIKAMTMVVSDKKIRIFIATHDAFIYLNEIDFNNDGYYILMETELSTAVNQDIPIFAYTKGIQTSSRQYCDLRDSKVHPKEWHKEFGIENYIYYTINFTNPDLK